MYVEMSEFMPQGLFLLYATLRISWGCKTLFCSLADLDKLSRIQINSYLHEYMSELDDR